MLVQLNSYVGGPLQIESKYHSASYDRKNLDIWMYTNSTEVFLNYSLVLVAGVDSGVGFEIRFKCMSGFANENAKFIMPLPKKLSYFDSFSNCDNHGFTNHFYYLIKLKITYNSSDFSE